MVKTKKRSLIAHIQNNIIFGLFILIPLLLSLYVGYFIFIMLANLTYPFVVELKIFSSSTNDYLLYLVSFLLTLLIIYGVGVAGKMWLGRTILSLLNRTLENIPLIGSFYKALKQLTDSFNQQDKSAQKVVLINFPSEEMKTIGFIIKTFADAASGRMLASVYVPTTPNPTSGYLEIVPLENTIPLDWTFEEAMSFIISGGSSMPKKAIRFS